MDGHNSTTLELVKYDETARAPERDYEATPSELRASTLAPQVVPDTTPQVAYGSSFPEVHGISEDSTKERATSLRIIKPVLRWPLMVMALMVAAAISIGVGVGIWRHRERELNQSSTMISPPAPQIVLNDTSLAVLSLANGDRHLYFQDNTGLIRRAAHTASNNQWSTSSKLSLVSNAKKYTPLAVNIVPASPTLSEPQIWLYYVSESHILNVSYYTQGTSTWTAVNGLPIYTTALNTRSLSITPIGSDWNATNDALIYYENPTGNVSAILQQYQGDYERDTPFQYVDITRQSKALPDGFLNVPDFASHTLYESRNDIVFRAPFTTGANWSGVDVGALLYSPLDVSSMSNGPLASGGTFVYADYIVGPTGAGNFSLLPSTALGNYCSINKSDVALFDSQTALWINGTQPAIIEDNTGDGPQAGTPTPDSTFPFARLTSVSSADNSATYLYHQINGTTFAEEQWDKPGDAWLPSVYITLSDS